MHKLFSFFGNSGNALALKAIEQRLMVSFLVKPHANLIMHFKYTRQKLLR
jgi:hypothetical protein